MGSPTQVKQSLRNYQTNYRKWATFFHSAQVFQRSADSNGCGCIELSSRAPQSQLLGLGTLVAYSDVIEY